MTKKFKKILFISTLLGFIIFAPILVFYSQGYRFDFSNRKIVQIGGLFFNVSPNGSKISIDEKISRKTSFIFGSSFINGLMPKKYEIQIEKENYYSWQKSLEVQEQKVTECKDIQLFLKNPEFSLLSSGISDIFVAPNQQKLVIKKQDESGWRLELFNLGTKESTLIVKEENFIKEIQAKVGTKLLLQFIEFSDDSNKVLLKIIIDAEDKYFLIDLLDSQKLTLINPSEKIKSISFKPNNGKELFLIGSSIEKQSEEKEIQYYNDALFSFVPGREKMLQYIELPVLNQKIMSYAISNGNIIWMDGTGFLYKGQIKENKVELLEILSLKPLLIHEQSNYKIITNNLSQIFVKEDETLYFLDSDAHMLTRVFASLKEYKFSLDNKKIAMRNEHEIVIIFLEKQTEQPQRRKQEKLRLIGISENLDNLLWLNNHYLIFKADDAIKIIEIDDRDKPNLIELTTFPESKISWLENQKSLLILSDNAIYLTKDVLK